MISLMTTEQRPLKTASSGKVDLSALQISV